MRTAAAGLAALALVAAGCGDDGSGGGTGEATVTSAATATATVPPAETTPPARTAPAETEPPAQTAPPETTPPADAGSPEDQPGGAGDEEPIRVPARFVIGRNGVRPAEISVPAFLNIRLVGVSRDGRAHTIVFEGTTIEVPAGGRAGADIGGLEAGRYGVEIDGRADAATIVSGVEPGP